MYPGSTAMHTNSSESARHAMKRLEGVREPAVIAIKIKRLKITAKGAVNMLIIAFTRFMAYRSETAWNSGSGRLKQDGAGNRT